MTQFDAYRIHSRDESPATVLDMRRPDGWVADDEALDTQPLGVSCCLTLDDLAQYVAVYSMGVQPGDVVVGLRGDNSGHRDRDDNAVRLIVESYEVLWDAQAFLRAQALVDDVRWYLDQGESVETALEDMQETITATERSVLDALIA